VLTDLLENRQRAAPDESRSVTPSPGCLRRAPHVLLDDLGRGQVGPFLDLQRGQRVDEQPVARSGQPHLTVGLPDRSGQVDHSQGMCGHRSHIPAGAFGGLSPVLRP
jgi:hypothetical protein